VTEELYATVARDIVVAAMEGYHGAVCAYGQTSTGKTHTMMGAPGAPGIVPLAIDECFRHIAASTSGGGGASSGAREYVLRVSYLEIYNEVERAARREMAHEWAAVMARIDRHGEERVAAPIPPLSLLIHRDRPKKRARSPHH
jgi:hypothetical protein